MNKLILPILLIIGVLIVSGCTQSVDIDNNTATHNGKTETDSQKDRPVYFSSSGLNPTETSEKLKKDHLETDRRFLIIWNNNLDIPQFVGGFRTNQYPGTPQNAATSFLQEYGDLIKLENNSLFLSDVYESGTLTTVVYEQRYKGVPFYSGGEVHVTVNEDNSVRSLSAKYFPRAKFEEASEADQSTIAETLRGYLIGKGITDSELDYWMEYFKPELIIYPLNYPITKDTEFRLTWLYRISQNRLFIDASTAKIVGDEATF